MLDLPSQTARRVAAYRLGFERVAASFGDPGADERLATDVADPLTFEPTERWARYLQGRTAFYDRVVVNALERGVTQVLTVGAGYDGRSLRYAKPGVRWFEVDHPFPVARPMAATQADAAVLRLLEQADFPAERCARKEPVTTYQQQPVLVTEFVAGKKLAWNQATFRQFGDLLGRLHTLPVSSGADGLGAGGAWHHLVSPGGPSEEVAAAGALLQAAAPRAPAWRRAMYDELRDAVARAEDCGGLPEALIHPDFAPVNAIASASGGAVVVDWTGAGVGPRLWSLAFLLWAAGGGTAACVDAVMSGYRGRVDLSPAERDRLPAAIGARPVLFSSWSFCTGRAKLSEVSGKLPEIAARASRIARRALALSTNRPDLATIVLGRGIDAPVGH